MSELLQIFYTYPPTVPSRCRQKPPCGALICHPCPPSKPPCPGNPKVQYQLTYTCNRSTYEPCYCPAIPFCPPPSPSIKSSINCDLKFINCCGKIVGKK